MSDIGTLIDGCYRLERKLGEGGFGTVYLCIDTNLERPVALKMLREGSATESELRRFLAEGKNLAGLSHPNVVQVYRLGSHEGRPFIVMEYIDGRTFSELQREKPLPLEQSVALMQQVACGLHAIHTIGVLHRDLSPHNVMVTAGGTAKVLDMGLSKDMRRRSLSDSRGALIGTMAYVSPEHVAGEQATVRSEVFSFGVLLYEACTGRNPFTADNHVALLNNIVQCHPEPIEDLFQNCPPQLASLVGDCLAKSPEDRPRDMAEVVRRLGDLMVAARMSGLTTVAIAPPSAALGGRARNPYLNRVMIKTPGEFFGRTQELKRVFARLNATPPGSISIVGDRKIGKSSLLNHVYSRAQREQRLDQPERMLMVVLDFQEKTAMSTEGFVRLLISLVGVELRGRLNVADCPPTLDGIKEMVQRLDGAGLRLAILLDEFDVVTTNPNFSLEFFSFLRFLANHYNVAYLTSSARDLQSLCHTKEISDSPFFNIFSTLRLSVFQSDEALEFIRVPSERVGRPLAPFGDQILALAGRFPFYLQMACSHSIEYLEEQPAGTAPDFNEIRRRFLQEAALHYRYVWDGLDGPQRSALVRLSRGRSIPDALRHVAEELKAKHFVEETAARPGLFSSTFEEFVRTEGARGEIQPSLLARLLRRDPR